LIIVEREEDERADEKRTSWTRDATRGNKRNEPEDGWDEFRDWFRLR